MCWPGTHGSPNLLGCLDAPLPYLDALILEVFPVFTNCVLAIFRLARRIQERLGCVTVVCWDPSTIRRAHEAPNKVWESESRLGCSVLCGPRSHKDSQYLMAKGHLDGEYLLVSGSQYIQLFPCPPIQF